MKQTRKELNKTRRRYYKKNKVQMSIIRHKHYEIYKETIKIKNKEYVKQNKEKVKKRRHKHYLKNKWDIRAYQRKWNKRNELHLKEYHHKYYLDNIDTIKKRSVNRYFRLKGVSKPQSYHPMMES